MVTNASNETQYFHFPLFESGDKPSWLTDWNGTVEELDDILQEHKLNIEANTQAMQSFNEQVQILKNSVVAVNEALASTETTVAQLTEKVNGFQTALIQADASIKDILARLHTAETEIDTLTNNMTTLASNVEQDLSDLSTSIENDILTVTNYVQSTSISALKIAKALGATEWDGARAYNKGKLVYVAGDTYYDFTLYIARDSVPENTDISDTTYWTSSNDTTQFAECLNFQDNVLDSFNHVANKLYGIVHYGITDKQWTNGTSYLKGDYVYTEGSADAPYDMFRQKVFGYRFYECKADHTASSDNAPGNTTYWQQKTLIDVIKAVESDSTYRFNNLGFSYADNLRVLTNKDIAGSAITEITSGPYRYRCTTPNLRSYLVGSEPRSVSKITSISCKARLYRPSGGASRHAVSVNSICMKANIEGNDGSNFKLVCYNDAVEAPITNPDAVYDCNITGLSYDTEFDNSDPASLADIIYLTYSVDAPLFTRKYIEANNYQSIFLVLDDLLAVTFISSGGSIFSDTVPIGEIEKMRIKKAGV